MLRDLIRIFFLKKRKVKGVSWYSPSFFFKSNSKSNDLAEQRVYNIGYGYEGAYCTSDVGSNHNQEYSEEVVLEKLPETLTFGDVVHILHWNMERIVNETNKLNPEMVFITGDMVDGSARLHKHTFKSINALKAPVFFVTGNHGVCFSLPFQRNRAPDRRYSFQDSPCGFQCKRWPLVYFLKKYPEVRMVTVLPLKLFRRLGFFEWFQHP